MASKRNGRTYLEDGHRPSQDDPQSLDRNVKQEGSAPNDDKRVNAMHRNGAKEYNHEDDAGPSFIVSNQANAAVSLEIAGQMSSWVGSGRQAEHILSVLGLAGAAPIVSVVSSNSAVSTPSEGRPANFGVVFPGVYRSSQPKPDGFVFLQQLGLKTVVTLGQRDGTDTAYSDFLAANHISQHIIDMKGTKKESIPTRTMQDILRIVLDQQNHPLLIHCNHGKHRTGCVVAVIRKVSGWDLSVILDEYRYFAAPKIRLCDETYITDFELRDLSNLFVNEAKPRLDVKGFPRATLFAFCVLVLWFISGRRISDSAKATRSLR